MKNQVNSSLILVFIGFIMACNPYNKPGSRGTIPTPDPLMWNAGQNAIYSEDNSNPDSLPCEEIYGLAIRTSEVAMSCENYNFSHLYNKAISLFDVRKSELKCRSMECNSIKTKLLYQTGVCIDSVATVIMKYEIKCVKNNIPDEIGLPIKTGTELLAPFKDSLPVPLPDRNDNSLVQVWNDAHAQGCPYTFEYKINLLAQVPSCDLVTDYKPYIQKAEAMARKVWSETRCTSVVNCNKQSPQEIGVKWSCQNNKVWVEYWFKVPCTL